MHTGGGTCKRQPQAHPDKQEVRSMVASAETIAAVRGVLDRFAATYSAKDEAGVLGCFAVGSDGKLTDWLTSITADCPKKHSIDMSDQCGACCPDLPRVL